MRTTPALPGEYADYLEAHGWTRTDASDGGSILFSKNDLRLCVKGDALDLLIENPFSNNGRPTFELLFSFIGWSALGFMAWTMLMHIIDAVPLKAFLLKVKQEVTRGASPLHDLMNHFRIADHMGVPEAY